MSETNLSIVKKAFKGYEEHIDKVVYNALDKWCVQILRDAIRNRYQPTEDRGHNFTGNLINSIVVILYRRSNGKKTTYYADSTGLKPAIRREISGLNYRRRYRRYDIYFRRGSRWGERDWTGRMSKLRADGLVATDESYGINDAHQFANIWYPTTNDDFVICVAYTSEYAYFVEQQRQTTGFLETMAYVGTTAIEYVGLQ